MTPISKTKRRIMLVIAAVLLTCVFYAVRNLLKDGLFQAGLSGVVPGIFGLGFGATFICVFLRLPFDAENEGLRRSLVISPGLTLVFASIGIMVAGMKSAETLQTIATVGIIGSVFVGFGMLMRWMFTEPRGVPKQ